MKALIAWYGSFAGHGTIGDLLSVEAITHQLTVRGVDVSHASAESYVGIAGHRVDWKAIDPGNVGVLIFVCGPIMKQHAGLQRLFEKFRRSFKLGVGVSLFAEDHPNYFNPFDQVFAREGDALSYEDIAILAPLPRPARRGASPGLRIGVSLRGKQSEYGVDNCLHAQTEEKISEALQMFGEEVVAEVIPIEHHLERAAVAPEAIDNLYDSLDAVMTTRLHGALLAIRHEVPFVAVDQIRAGAKVSRILGAKPWPFVYRTEETSVRRLKQALHAACRAPYPDAMRQLNEETRKAALRVINLVYRAVEKANGSLSASRTAEG